MCKYQQNVQATLLEMGHKRGLGEVETSDMDCAELVEVLAEYFDGRMRDIEERRTLAEDRVKELTEGLKETMVLFKEREEDFDSLARINKEQEVKVVICDDPPLLMTKTFPAD